MSEKALPHCGDLRWRFAPVFPAGGRQASSDPGLGEQGNAGSDKAVAAEAAETGAEAGTENFAKGSGEDIGDAQQP